MIHDMTTVLHETKKTQVGLKQNKDTIK